MTRLRWMTTLRSLMNRPMLGTTVVPPGATVEPDLFPEDEFPLRCTTCDYLLRGLPDGRCPECGTPFTRARQLVVQYVLDPRCCLWRHSRRGRLLVRLAVAGVVTMVFSQSALLAGGWWLSHRLAVGSVPRVAAAGNWWYVVSVCTHAVWWLQIVLLAGLLTCGGMLFKDLRAGARKRRCVAQAAAAPVDSPIAGCDRSDGDTKGGGPTAS